MNFYGIIMRSDLLPRKKKTNTMYGKNKIEKYHAFVHEHADWTRGITIKRVTTFCAYQTIS